MKAQRKNWYYFYVLVVLSMLVLLPHQGSSGYILDPDFGEGGIRVAEIGNFDDRAVAAALQPDGKIVVAGMTEIGAVSKIAVLRFNKDGSLDTDFNVHTGALEDGVGAFNDGANSILILEDGNILVAGYSENVDQEKQIVLVQLTSTGLLDEDFGDSGVARLEVAGEQGEAFGLAIDAEQRILVAGVMQAEDQKWAVAARFLADGILDESGFGENGYRKIEFSDDSDDTTAAFIGIQSDEKIILGGSKGSATATNGALFRLTGNGEDLDTTYGVDGVVIVDPSFADSAFRAATILVDDSLVVTGFTTSNGYTSATSIKIDATGDLDSTFGAGGSLISDLGGESKANAIIQKSDGAFLIVGEAENAQSNNDDVVLIEVDSSGSKQNTTILSTREQATEQKERGAVTIGPFAIAEDVSIEDYESVAVQQRGVAILQDVAGADDSGQAVLFTPENKVVVAGFANDGNADNVALLGFASDDDAEMGTEAVGLTGESPFAIVTLPVTNVQRNSAMSGGVITQIKDYLDCDVDPDGKNCIPNIVQRGVVFATTPFPSFQEVEGENTTIVVQSDASDDDDGEKQTRVFPKFAANSPHNYNLVRGGQTSDGVGDGTFGSDINAVTPDTLYYVRAYAVLSTTANDTIPTTYDVVYGNQMSFTTDDACFIATAAYGSLLEPHVSLLRQFRDEYLKTNQLGRKFVSTYYRFSPPLAEFIAQSSFMRFSVRLLLLPLVGFSYLMLNFSLLLKTFVVLLIGGTLLCTRRILSRR